VLGGEALACAPVHVDVAVDLRGRDGGERVPSHRIKVEQNVIAGLLDDLVSQRRERRAVLRQAVVVHANKSSAAADNRLGAQHLSGETATFPIISC
jgi:hypothetical protein